MATPAHQHMHLHLRAVPCTHASLAQHFCTHVRRPYAQAHKLMRNPPHAPWHTHACAVPGRAAREPADTLHNRPAYLLAGVLDPSQQKPISRLLSHPREFTGLSAPHKSISSSSSSSSPATSKGPASDSDRRRESDCFLSLPLWTGEVERRGKSKAEQGKGPASIPRGVPLFITGLIPSCLSSHLRGHRGNQMKCQAQERGSQPPELRRQVSQACGN
jgi:hypothetical protein